ncbi:MAG: hypothetical protein J6Z79_02275 [Clostridia bacterium]|nr:hypothetical protein [Clostridia bacterium]
MELDRDLLEKVLGMDDGALRDAATRVALGLGLDESLLKPYLMQADQIRAAIAKLTPQDLDRVGAVLGEERLKTTLTQLKQEVDNT